MVSRPSSVIALILTAVAALSVGSPSWADVPVVPLLSPAVVSPLGNQEEAGVPPLGPGFPVAGEEVFGRRMREELGRGLPEEPGYVALAPPVSPALLIPVLPQSVASEDSQGGDLAHGSGEMDARALDEIVTESLREVAGPLAGLGIGALLPGQSGAAPSLGDAWLSGYDSFPPNSISGPRPTRNLRRGLAFSLSLVGVYDSDASQGYGGDVGDGGEDARDDFAVLLGGGVSYRSGGSTWTYGLSYSGGFRQYFNQDDLSGGFHSGGGSVTYSSGPLSVELGLGLGFGSGANRNYESVTDATTYSYSLSSRYQFSGKTSLAGDFAQSFSTASGAGNLDIGSFDAGLSLLWSYSALTEFGPGLRYARRTQEEGAAQNSIGPMVSLNHELTRKVSLNSRIGLDFTGLEGESIEELTWSTAVGLGYRASSLWGPSLTLLRDSQASFTTLNQFEDIWALRLGYNRKLWRASWNLGLGYENRSAKNASSVGGRDYFSADTSLAMGLFGDAIGASVFASFRDESSGDGSWDSFQVGIGLNRSF